ncbi:MAG: tRNA dimethylallyltransferase [Elusimicrobia bacterium]|nr:tRNA dimethylallyltransferase [Elusimicrobiota bacterium]
MAGAAFLSLIGSLRMSPAPPFIPVLLGQTATGKTAIGIALARIMGGEIISVDSRKVYEGLPIGTATPKGQRYRDSWLVEGVPHHLMAFLKPDQPYNAGDFAQDASQLIEEILARGKRPLLVGGTGFYFKALAQGLPPLPKADAKLRHHFELKIQKEGIQSLRQELSRVDPEAAQAITSRDQHKIIRALEVFHLTGLPFSSWKNQARKQAPYPFVVMGLQYPSKLLEKRIEERSKRMLEEGMIEETAAALREGYSPNCAALSSFGYREAVQVVQGKISRSDFLKALIKGTKAYAKRQRTWFRTQISPSWFLCDDTTSEVEMAEKMKAFCYTRDT